MDSAETILLERLSDVGAVPATLFRVPLGTAAVTQNANPQFLALAVGSVLRVIRVVS